MIFLKWCFCDLTPVDVITVCCLEYLLIYFITLLIMIVFQNSIDLNSKSTVRELLILKLYLMCFVLFYLHPHIVVVCILIIYMRLHQCFYFYIVSFLKYQNYPHLLIIS